MTKEILTEAFEACRSELKSFILRMTASVQDTEDIVQETFIRAVSNLNTFKKNSSLKTWIFSIASNLAKDHLKAKKRWVEHVTDICKTAALSNQPFFTEAMQISQTSPQGQFEIKEHITFCFTCISKSLPLEQHLVILLKEVYDFRIKEIATIIAQSEAMVKYHLHAGRNKMINIFHNRCSLINKQGACHQCTELNGIFNPQQKAAEEVVKIKMVREAAKKDKAYLFDLRTKIVKGIDPFNSNGAELQRHHLEHNRQVMDQYLKKN
jgi:RNA polymerase sigma-70 factor (ECF subfamily)